VLACGGELGLRYKLASHPCLARYGATQCCGCTSAGQPDSSCTCSERCLAPAEGLSPVLASLRVACRGGAAVRFLQRAAQRAARAATRRRSTLRACHRLPVSVTARARRSCWTRSC